MSKFQSTKVLELGSCAFRQFAATGHCRYVHGYQLKAKFWFGCDHLDDKNWAVDFSGLKELKAMLQHQFDHTLCIAANDPCLELFKQLHQAGGCDLRIFENGVGIERTAEYCFSVADKHIRELTNNRCWVEQVEVFEHELNSALYRSTDASNLSVVNSTVLLNEDTTAAPTLAQSTEVVPQKRPAHVGPNVTTGKSDWFAGTTWS